jgi:hypothetical protein
MAFDGDRLGGGFPTAVGAATGAIVGLVGITPSAGLVAPMWALFIGAFTAFGVFFAPRLLRRFLGINDTLEVTAMGASYLLDARGACVRYFPTTSKIMPERNQGHKVWLARGVDLAGNHYENV